LRSALELNEQMEANKSAWNSRVEQLQNQMTEKRKSIAQLEIEIGIMNMKVVDATESRERKIWELLQDTRYRRVSI
jgi:hypothetical protein